MNQWMITRVTSEFRIASCGIGFDLPALAAVGSGFRTHRSRLSNALYTANSCLLVSLSFCGEFFVIDKPFSEIL